MAADAVGLGIEKVINDVLVVDRLFVVSVDDKRILLTVGVVGGGGGPEVGSDVLSDSDGLTVEEAEDGGVDRLTLGVLVRASEGLADGLLNVGGDVGLALDVVVVGAEDGPELGSDVPGVSDGLTVGEPEDGTNEGLALGDTVVGDAVGLDVGLVLVVASVGLADRLLEV